MVHRGLCAQRGTSYRPKGDSGMLSRLVGIGLLGALTGGAVHAAGAPRRAALRRATVSPAYVPGELVVRFKPEATAADRKAVLQAEDARAQTAPLVQGEG